MVEFPAVEIGGALGKEVVVGVTKAGHRVLEIGECLDKLFVMRRDKILLLAFGPDFAANLIF